MSEWRDLSVAELGELFDGPHATPTRTSDGPYFLNISSLSNGRLDLSQSDHVSEDDFLKWTRRVTPVAGDLLFSYETRLGDAALMPDGIDACLGRRMALIRPDRRLIDPRFLLYLYLSPSFQTEIASQTIHGATVNRIPLNSMPRWRTRIPNLTTQHAIAEVLGALDDKIAANTKLASNADEYLSELLGRLVAESPAWTNLASIAMVNATSVRPGKDGNLRYVDIASVNVGSFDFPPVTEWSTAPGRARRKLSPGDTLWSTVRPNRRSHALNLHDDPLLIGSTGLAVLSPSKVGFAYLYEVTRLPQFSAYLETVAEGSAYPAVRAERFLDAPVPELSSGAIDLFEVVGSELRRAVSSAESESRTLAEFRDALLPQLMSGKLRVRDAERTVSEVL